MPNLSPPVQRKKYELYDHKACTGAEAAEGLSLLEKELQQIGYTISKDRGDYNDLTRKQKNVS
jgi:biotin synthase